MHIYAVGCWNDISCSHTYPFICGMPFCKRELTLNTQTQSQIRVSQGETGASTTLDKQTDYYTPFNVETCVLLYTTPDGATNTEGVTMSISGEIATVAAPTFNQAAIDTAIWTVTKTI